MARDMIPIEQAANRAPARMRERIAAGQGLTGSFADNVRDSFRVLSVKGKIFRVREGQREEIWRDPATNLPYGYLDVVLVNASRALAKTYYKTGFQEGILNPPDCWSLDSIRPDPSVVAKVNPTCPDCPFNQFGSRVTPDGKAAKACSDSRRMAVTLPHVLDQSQPHDPLLLTMLLRVPQSSLKNLKNYVEKLARNGFEPGGCVTRVTFDTAAAFPKLVFDFVCPLNDYEFERVVGIAQSPFVSSMLVAPDFENIASAANPTVPPVGQRQAPPVTGTGFGAGMMQEEEPERDGMGNRIDGEGEYPTSFARPQGQALPGVLTQPMQQQTPYAQQAQAPAQQSQPTGTLRLPTGELLDLATGQIVPELSTKAEPELDPDVIAITDGRFYHRSLGKFVDSPYRGGSPAAETSQPAPEKAKGKRTRVKLEEGKAEAKGDTKGNGEAPEPIVVAATPELEQLLGTMVPKKS